MGRARSQVFDPSPSLGIRPCRSRNLVDAAGAKVRRGGLQHGFETPGLLASRQQVPPSSDHGFEALAKGMDVAFAVDAGIWFVLLCMLAIGVAIVRSRRAKRAVIEVERD